jgi:hypothetical protein
VAILKHLLGRHSVSAFGRIDALAPTPAQSFVHQLRRLGKLVENGADHGQLSCEWVVDHRWNQGQLIE